MHAFEPVPLCSFMSFQYFHLVSIRFGAAWLESLPSSKSLEKRLSILPVGVVSKNFMGLRMILMNTWSWSLLEASSVIWGKEPKIGTAFSQSHCTNHPKTGTAFSQSHCTITTKLVQHSANHIAQITTKFVWHSQSHRTNHHKNQYTYRLTWYQCSSGFHSNTLNDFTVNIWPLKSIFGGKPLKELFVNQQKSQKQAKWASYLSMKLMNSSHLLLSLNVFLT